MDDKFVSRIKSYVWLYGMHIGNEIDYKLSDPGEVGDFVNWLESEPIECEEDKEQ